VALIAAVAGCPSYPVVEHRHMEWAERLVKLSLDTLMQQAKRFLADSEHERLIKKVRDALKHSKRKDGDGWLTGREVARATQFLKRRERNEIILHLEEVGELELRSEDSEKKPKTFVRVRA
jgi:hypothetical protein